ncbi:MAG: class I SAM-dependent methyltransferase [Planctomycetota bacterium]
MIQSATLDTASAATRCCEACGSSRVNRRYSFDGFQLLACTSCDMLWIPDPPVDIRGLYSAEYYAGRRNYYFGNSITDPAQRRENANIRDFQRGLDLLERERPPARSKLLDVGCAIGVFLSLARDRGWQARGIDISSYATEYARRTFQVDAVCGELATAGIPDGEFDVITLWDVFEHFPDPARQLREMHRILKDDGLVLLDTPNSLSLLRRLAHLLYRASLGRLTYPAQKLHHVFHLYYYSRESLRRMVERYGFEVVWMRGKTIPLVKARGNRLERSIVGTLAVFERTLGMEYELLTLLRKKPDLRFDAAARA